MAKMIVGVTVTVENERKDDTSTATLRFLKLTGEVSEIDLEQDADSQLLSAEVASEKAFKVIFDKLREQVRDRMIRK